MTLDAAAPVLIAVGASLAGPALVYLAVLSSRRVTAPASSGETGTRRRFARNAITPIISNLMDRALFWAFWIVALRILGPAGNGEYAFATNLLIYFAVLVDFGLGTLVTREVARQRDALQRIFRQTLALRLRALGLSIPAMLGTALIFWATGTISDRTLVVATILAAGLIPSAANQAFASVYGGWERMDRRALVVVGTSGLTVGLGLLFLGLGLGVIGIALAGLIAAFATLVGLGRPLGFGLLTSGVDSSWAELRALARAALPLMLNSLLATAFIQIDVLILQPLQGTVVVGHYNAAYKFINALNVIPAAVVLAAFPVMSRAAADPEELRRWFARTWRVLAMVAAAAVMPIFIFAEPIIDSVLGDAYLPASATALSILIWFLPLSYLNGTLQYVVIAQDRQWWLTPAFLVTTAFNIGTNLALVPAFGFRAAAATTIASEIVLLLMFGWVLRRDGLLRSVLEPAWRPVLGGAGFAAAAWAARDAPWVLALLAGGAAYVAVLLATGGLRPAHIRELRTALTPRSAAD